MEYPYPHCKCGKTAILKDGKHGKFFACPDWPKCPGETCSYEAWRRYHANDSVVALATIDAPLRGDNASRRFVKQISDIAENDPLSPEAQLLSSPEEDGYSGQYDEEWHDLDNCFKPD